MDKFRHKLPKEDLKKFAKEINKKLVSSDYKNKRVDDPTLISEKQEKKVKKYVKDFFDKAVHKYNVHEKRKAERSAQNGAASSFESSAAKDEADVVLTDDEDVGSTPDGSDRKRKREDDHAGSPSATPSEPPSMKRLKEEEVDVPSPPPPPPPPPPEIDVAMDLEMTDQHQVIHGQDEALAHENHAAHSTADDAERRKLREQEAELERENELNRLDFEREQMSKQGIIGNTSIDINGSSGLQEDDDGSEGGLKHADRNQEVMSH
jgi:hypothetical protein